ncbi:phytanoyl-CoA dioxygenase family protein [Bimuria novae-zelandiae CBS 107.79]|uniref:Phytanoyl-CoA dioxygenase family protein n=1 Tax=Bimuria novae-zelandiae CBS 107.79 TaxID=1447943 RepID=A0A6A5VGE1_9PLEO|nr:phytanoyl-CoA dioxygenase family protein [Bimuria novae-zelandiae CBS 107.79]
MATAVEPPTAPTNHTTARATATPSPYAAARAALSRDGFVVLPAHLFLSIDLPALRAAASTLTVAARAGHWPYIRTLPKQFPPWPSDASLGVWGVQHLLHPSNPSHTIFARSYFDAELLKYVAALIDCEEEELTMELYNMLVRPDRAFALRWHRDDILASATEEEEMDRLARPAWHAQWNLALYDDASLVVVPGSHKRARTPEERAADPYEPHLPGQKVVQLKAGEVVFYNNNILHRGVYDEGRERMTLHGSIGTARAGKERARNVLQHGVGEWAAEDDFGHLEAGMRARARAMREKLVELGRSSWEVGFYSKDE